MDFYGQNWKIWMWTMFIFCVKSFQAEWFLETLLGYAKDKVYADASQSIQELKEKICVVNDEIELQMCENVMENFIKYLLIFPNDFSRLCR